MGERNFTSERRTLIATLIAFAFMACLAAIDLFSDLRGGTTVHHILTEGGILLVGFVGSGIISQKLISTLRAARASSAAAQSLAGQLAASQAEAERWRSEARDLVAGLGQAIDAQFERWGLSTAEKEVGLLLLKGLSHKEIAEARSVTEATARQQARALYKKAGLTGRHDLAAFFLEDLMLPTPSDATSHETAAQLANEGRRE